MKRILPILLAFLMLLLSVPAAAQTRGAAEPPEDVLAYARGDGQRLMKEYLRFNGYLGAMFETEEEIDALTLGRGFPLYELRFSAETDGTAVQAHPEPTGDWLFFLDDEEGAAVHFLVTTQEDGSLVYAPDHFLCRLAPAMTLLEGLCAEEGVAFAPMIAHSADRYIVVQDFGGDERLVMVPDWELPDPSYQRVKRHTELPTYAEYMEQIGQRQTSAEPASLTNGHAPLLKPHLDRTRTYTALAIACAAVLAAAVIAAELTKKKRSAW